MSQNTQTYFELALKRLEQAYQDLKKKNIDFKETEKIKFLQEIIKEQMSHENSDSAAR